MKKQTLFLTAFALFVLSLNLSAYDGLKLNALPDKNHPFKLSPSASDSDEGVKGKIIITAGIGLNFIGTSLELRYLTSPYYYFEGNLNGHKASPMYNVAVDYGLGEKVSVGVAFGYQTIQINFRDIYTTGDSYHDNWTRIHFAARGDYYIVAKENISLYTGVKLGYNLYTVTTTLPANDFPNYTENLGVYPPPVSAQAHFGFSYFVSGIFGVNAEFGLGYGGPYMFAAGATVKI